MQASEPVFN